MHTRPPQIFPSILSGDFGHLAEVAHHITQAGADAIHIDIMDGHFVPNLTLGPRAVAAINKATPLFLDVHLMIYNPYDFVEAFVAAGADRITFHFEATEDVEDTIEFIRRCGVKAGLAFRPETSFAMIPKYLLKSDLLLIMTVSPGFGGQAFMPEMLEKVRLAREHCERHGIRQGGVIAQPGMAHDALPPFDIQVDGGIHPSTAADCLKVGANILVSGDFLFRQTTDMAQGISRLRQGH